MTMIRLIALFCWIAVGVGCRQEANERPPADLTAEHIRLGREATSSAFAALDSGNTVGFLDWMKAATTYRPGHPTLVYHLSRAYMLNDSLDAAFSTLEGLAQMGVEVGFDDPALQPIRQSERGRILEERLLKNGIPLIQSVPVYQGTDPNYQAEGVARYNGRWILASVHKNKVAYGDGSLISDLSPRSAMGMKRRGSILWVAATKTVEGGNKERETGDAQLVRINLETSEIEQRYALADTLSHWFGDLEIGPDGAVYISDSIAPGVYRLQNDTIVPVVVGAPFSSPQGIAMVEGALYVADYSAGIFHVNVDAQTARLLPGGAFESLLGIDGMMAYKRGVVAIQNGMSPPRVVYISLDADSGGLSSTTLESNHPDYHDPTLGVVENDTLFYMANSQWPLFSPGADSSKRVAPILLGVPLQSVKK